MKRRRREDARHEVSVTGATGTTIAVRCIRPSPHTGQRARSTPVSRCTALRPIPAGRPRVGLGEEVPGIAPGASPCAIGQQAEVANAHEAARHHMQQKASQEFVDVQRHDLAAVVVGVVLPAEADAAVVVIDEPIIRQRDAVGVPPEVVEHLLRTGEGPLRIHDPVDGSQLTEERVKARRSARSAVPPAKVSWPASNARCRPARYFARKTLDNARTGNRNDDRPAIHRARSWPTRRR